MPRIRDFGITPGYLPPGSLNAITDVAGVRVGHTTVNRDVDGVPWRTGVTAIWPHAGNPLLDNVYAAVFPLNGIGEMTARSLIDEWGLLGFPIMLTGTNSVGIVYHWTLQYLFEHGAKEVGMTSLIAMVAECDDSYNAEQTQDCSYPTYPILCKTLQNERSYPIVSMHRAGWS